jgi:hypothetical protein
MASNTRSYSLATRPSNPFGAFAAALLTPSSQRVEIEQAGHLGMPAMLSIFVGMRPSPSLILSVLPSIF